LSQAGMGQEPGCKRCGEAEPDHPVHEGAT
jgi:hypothetical protein